MEEIEERKEGNEWNGKGNNNCFPEKVAKKGLDGLIFGWAKLEMNK
jgi:hypothetical protein